MLINVLKSVPYFNAMFTVHCSVVPSNRAVPYVLQDTESITEDQAFSVSVVCFGSLHPLAPLLPSCSKLEWRHTGRLRKRGNLQSADGGAREPNHTTARNLVL
jgi:hypothetical protein